MASKSEGASEKVFYDQVNAKFIEAEKAVGLKHIENFDLRMFAVNTCGGYTEASRDKDIFLADFWYELKNKIIPILKKYAETQLATYRPDIRKTPQKRYSKSIKRRVRMVTFIGRTAKIFNMSNYENQSFQPHKRIRDWEAVGGKWNEEYPNDTMDYRTLKSEFYSAIKDEVVREAYFSEINKAILNAVEQSNTEQPFISKGGAV